MKKNRKLIARFIIIALLITPLSSIASVLVLSDHQHHCLAKSTLVDTDTFQQLAQQLCTMDDCIDLCKSLFHCASHLVSITSAEIGTDRINSESTVFQDITVSHPRLLHYSLFRPPRS